MNTTGNLGDLIRTDVWSRDLKEILVDELIGQSFVDWRMDFPDGDTLNIPSIGQLPVRNYTEDTPVIFDEIDTGNFEFTIGEYISSATYLTDKAKQDIYYAQELMSKFVPEQARAIAEHVENKIMGLQGDQTAGNSNTINGAAHRYLATGGNGTLALEDFAQARYALKKANVPDRNLIAVVHPEAELIINTLTNLVDVSNNPRWEGIVASGIGNGMNFIRNIYGFDVYVSNRLSDVATETIGGETVNNAKACMFFSADSAVTPFIGAWRQMPRVETERNIHMQRDEIVTTARYDAKLFRPENLVVVLADQATSTS